MTEKTLKKMAMILERIAAIHERIARSHPKLEHGQVSCRVCGKTLRVDVEECLISGWPVCCGETMTIDSAAEQS